MFLPLFCGILLRLHSPTQCEQVGPAAEVQLPATFGCMFSPCSLLRCSVSISGSVGFTMDQKQRREFPRGRRSYLFSSGGLFIMGHVTNVIGSVIFEELSNEQKQSYFPLDAWYLKRSLLVYYKWNDMQHNHDN